MSNRCKEYSETEVLVVLNNGNETGKIGPPAAVDLGNVTLKIIMLKVSHYLPSICSTLI